MIYKTFLVSEIPFGISVTINRPEKRNTLNSLLINELHLIMNEVEKNSAIRIVVLKGRNEIFCTGMDFSELTEKIPHEQEAIEWASQYMKLLNRFALIPKVIVAEIDGIALAGGIGLVAASDIAISTSRSQFSLSEGLWGLIPANVVPYLIRRVGFQKAYLMTLSTKQMTAAEAHAIHLIDDIDDNPEAALRKYTLRLSRLDERTIQEVKNYFRKMWILDEKMEQLAVHELAKLMQDPRIHKNIKSYVEEGKFPWEV